MHDLHVYISSSPTKNVLKNAGSDEKANEPEYTETCANLTKIPDFCYQPKSHPSLKAIRFVEFQLHLPLAPADVILESIQWLVIVRLLLTTALQLHRLKATDKAGTNVAKTDIVRRLLHGVTQVYTINWLG